MVEAAIGEAFEASLGLGAGIGGARGAGAAASRPGPHRFAGGHRLAKCPRCARKIPSASPPQNEPTTLHPAAPNHRRRCAGGGPATHSRSARLSPFPPLFAPPLSSCRFLSLGNFCSSCRVLLDYPLLFRGSPPARTASAACVLLSPARPGKKETQPFPESSHLRLCCSLPSNMPNIKFRR